MTSRPGLGFHRIGAVLAVSIALFGVALAGDEAWRQYLVPASYRVRANVPPSRNATPDPSDKLDDVTEAPSAEADPFSDLDTRLPPYRADYTGALIALAVAGFLYAAARVAGWLLDGFPPRGGPP